MGHRILIIGAGHVGSTLGRTWTVLGHDVRYGVPDPRNPKYAALPQERLQSAHERRGAQVIVLAVPHAAAASAVAALDNLSGAIVIDCTNPLAMGPDGLEPLAMLWIELAMKRGHAREFAFAMVRHPRSSPTAGVAP